MSGSLFSLTFTTGLGMHYFEQASSLLYISIFTLLFSFFFWFRDITNEATYLGDHTSAVQRGLNYGILLFIVSEALFFLAIFWAYFHNGLTPTVELGTLWPPTGLEPVNPFELPLLNTVILLSSGATITLAHHSLIRGQRSFSLYGSIATVILAILFTAFQAVEYSVSSFTMSDSIYGSCFFFGTGFHGLHVIIGTLFLAIGLWRIYAYHLTDHHHIGFETGILYWHFVDIVWLILYFSIYYWGS